MEKKLRKLSLLLATVLLISQSLLSSSLALAEVASSQSGSQSSETTSIQAKSANAPTIKLIDITIFVGQSFSSTDMIESAIDGDGFPIDYSKLTITGVDQVDTSAPGTFKIGFSYEGSAPVYATLTIKAQERIAPVDNPKNVTAGVPLSSNELVVLSAKSDDLSPDYNQVSFSGQTDSGTLFNQKSPEIGTYNITATYKDSSTTFKLVVTKNYSDLSLSKEELTVDLDDTSELKKILDDPYSIVSSYKDPEGKSQTPSKDNVTVKNSTGLDSKNVGDYTIDYIGKNGKSSTLTIHITGNKIQLNSQDVTLSVGDSFDKSSGLKSATDIHGVALDVPTSIADKTITESDNVDPNKAGNYTISYSYYGVSATAKVTVKARTEDGIYIDSNKLARYKGADFNETDFLSQVIYNGNIVDKNLITATYDKTKINTVGSFDITYTYKELTKTATVTVTEDLSSVSFLNGTSEDEESVYSGQYNEPFANIVFVDPTGKSYKGIDAIYYKKLDGITFTAKTTKGNISTSSIPYVNYYKNQTGTIKYTITYRGHTVTKTINVLPIQTAIKTKDTTLVENFDTWKADDNFISATTYDGKDAKYSRVSGSVPTDDAGIVNKIGSYQVTYTIDGIHIDNKDEQVSSTATIRVIKDLSELNLKSATIYSGDSWKASNQFISGLQKNGLPLTSEDIATDVGNTAGKMISYTITNSEGEQVDSIDNTKSGKYTITYQYGSVTKSTTLTVISYTPKITVHDSSVFVGAAWTASDNFDLANTASGKRLTFSDLTVDASAVDLKTAGEYQVKYTYGKITSVAKVTVKERKLGINVHDIKIPLESSWTASENFDSALDSDGDTVEFDKLTITITDESGKELKTIDTSKVGTYTIVYSYTDKTNTSTTSKAQVVIYNATDLQVTNVRIPINSEWDPSSAFIAATSPSGISKTWDQIKDVISITGTVDTNVAKSYSLTYTYEGVTKNVKVTVVGERTLTVPNSTNFGSVTLGPTNSDLNLTYPGGDIIVKDTVENSKGWILTAKVSDSTSDFNQYLMNGDKTLAKNSKLGSKTSGGSTTVSEGWKGTKKGLWVDYSKAQKVRADDVKITYTLTPGNLEVAE